VSLPGDSNLSVTEHRGYFDRNNTREARQTCPAQIWRVAQRKLDQLNGVVSLDSLKSPGKFLESLRDERKGQHSIRINDHSVFVLCGLMMGGNLKLQTTLRRPADGTHTQEWSADTSRRNAVGGFLKPLNMTQSELAGKRGFISSCYEMIMEAWDDAGYSTSLESSLAWMLSFGLICS